MSELIGLLAGLAFTLFIYSYLVGDNPLYRVAIHILVGVSAAYAAVVAVRQIFAPLLQRLLASPSDPESYLWFIPLLLGLLLLLTWLRPVAWLGNTTLGALVGVGAAVALVGVIRGTLLPQVLGVGNGSLILTVVTALLTVCALLYFQFTGRQNRATGEFEQSAWQRAVSVTGHTVLMITFGALFAGAFSTSLVLLNERVSYFLIELLDLVAGYF